MTAESPHSIPFLVTEPTQICSFSRTETGATVFDDRSQRFFREPQLGIDLGAGWDDVYARYRNHKFIGHPRPVDEILDVQKLYKYKEIEASLRRSPSMH